MNSTSERMEPGEMERESLSLKSTCLSTCAVSRGFIGGIGKEACGYLTWTVSNNPKISRRCFVTVSLNGKDLYDVSVWYRKSMEAVILSESNDVYCDMLEDVIFSALG